MNKNIEQMKVQSKKLSEIGIMGVGATLGMAICCYASLIFTAVVAHKKMKVERAIRNEEYAASEAEKHLKKTIQEEIKAAAQK